MNRAAWAVILAAAFAACGTGRDDRPPRMDPAAQELTVPSGYQLRILGVDPDGFTHVSMQLQMVQMDADGTPIPFVPFSYAGGIDLANTSQAWLLGTFTPPAGTHVVHVRVVFNPIGSFVANNQAATLYVGCFDFKLDLQAAALALRNRAVIQLDLARSILAIGPRWGVVPQVLLLY